MARKKGEVDPKKEEIVQEIAYLVADYKKGPVDPRDREAIASDFFDYLLEKLDKYC